MLWREQPCARDRVSGTRRWRRDSGSLGDPWLFRWLGLFRWPINGTLVIRSFNLFLSRAIPRSGHLSSNASNLRSWSRRASSLVSLTPYMRMSSVMLSIPSSPSRAWLPRFWKISLDVDGPKGSLFHRYLPKGVAKVVKRRDLSSSTQCQNPVVRSTVEKFFSRASSGIKSSRIGSWWVSLFQAWFNGRGSMHILRAPDFFVAITTNTRSI